MVSMSASINAGDVARFNAALTEFASALGKNMSTAPQRAAIQICKSLRAAAGTKKAPKYARGSEYALTKSDTRPKYITKPDGTKLRRWKLDRSVVGRGVYDVYAERKGDVRRKRLLLARAGLARQSWGWVMHNIFNGAAPDTPWQRRRKDRRDPRDATRESTSSAQNGVMTATGFARICNRLDYIVDALKVPVDAAITKAANWMLHEAERRKPRLP